MSTSSTSQAICDGPCLLDDRTTARRHAQHLAQLMSPHTGDEEVGLFSGLRRQE